MLTDCTSVSIALSQLVRGRPQGLLQWLGGRSDAPMTRWWSCLGSTRATCPKKEAFTHMLVKKHKKRLYQRIAATRSVCVNDSQHAMEECISCYRLLQAECSGRDHRMISRTTWRYQKGKTSLDLNEEVTMRFWDASDLLIFLRTNWPQCMHVKHKNSRLSNYWPGSRRLCRTGSYACLVTHGNSRPFASSRRQPTATV